MFKIRNNSSCFCIFFMLVGLYSDPKYVTKESRFCHVISLTRAPFVDTLARSCTEVMALAPREFRTFLSHPSVPELCWARFRVCVIDRTNTRYKKKNPADSKICGFFGPKIPPPRPHHQTTSSTVLVLYYLYYCTVQILDTWLQNRDFRNSVVRCTF